MMKVHEKNHIPLVQIKELTWGYLDSKKSCLKSLILNWRREILP